MSKEQSCFCCSPTTPLISYSQEMPNHLLQEQTHITTSSSSSRESDYSFEAQSSTNDSPWLQGVNNPHITHPSLSEWNKTHEDEMTDQVTHQFDLCLIQNSNKLLTPSDMPITRYLGKQNSPFTFQSLQNRELRGKISGNVVSKIVSCLPLDSPRSYFDNNRKVENGCDNITVSTTSINPSNSMDLDSVLDELGMLSTITNSRKEYLLETQSHTSFRKHDQRLKSKSESVPNLAKLSLPNGYHIVQMNTDFVASVGGTCLINQTPNMYHKSQCMSEPSCLEYRTTNICKETTERQRSVPRMSRMRMDRYMFRRSRCPYKIPQRLNKTTLDTFFMPGNSSLFDSLLESGVHKSPSGQANCQQLPESKSSNASPVKPHTEMNLVRSLSVEDLAPMCRRLEQEISKQDKVFYETQQNLDSMTSQMTNLHMS